MPQQDTSHRIIEQYVFWILFAFPWEWIYTWDAIEKFLPVETIGW